MNPAPPAGGLENQLALVRQRMPALGRRDPLPTDPAHCAAVLIALSGPPDDLQVTLTRRAAHLNTHAGEVALPGGKYDLSDSGLDATALRESQEEIGLPASAVEMLGRLPSMRTRWGRRAVPFVGWVPALPALAPNLAELDRIFHVPLRFLADPRNLLCDEYPQQGAMRRIPRFHYESYAVWGFTASVLMHFCAETLGAPLELARAREVVNRIDAGGGDPDMLNRVPAGWLAGRAGTTGTGAAR